MNNNINLGGMGFNQTDNTMWVNTATAGINTVSPVTDPLEIAQLKFEGKCTECKHSLPDHEWHCSHSQPTITINTVGVGTFTTSNVGIMQLGNPASEWKCDAFGLDDGVRIYVSEGKQPCWFHRKMQQIFFGNKWSKQ
jgi:hypothetical protein